MYIVKKTMPRKQTVSLQDLIEKGYAEDLLCMQLMKSVLKCTVLNKGNVSGNMP